MSKKIKNRQITKQSAKQKEKKKRKKLERIVQENYESRVNDFNKNFFYSSSKLFAIVGQLFAELSEGEIRIAQGKSIECLRKAKNRKLKKIKEMYQKFISIYKKK